MTSGAKEIRGGYQRGATIGDDGNLLKENDENRPTDASAEILQKPVDETCLRDGERILHFGITASHLTDVDEMPKDGHELLTSVGTVRSHRESANRRERSDRERREGINGNLQRATGRTT